LQKHYLKFNDKCLEILIESGSITVHGNFDLEIRQRIIVTSGDVKTEIHSIRGGKKKVIYLHYDKFMGSECAPGHRVLDELPTHLAHIKYIESRLGGYLTIITSGYFLVDYIVVSSETVAIVTSGKREIYIDRNNNVAIYIV
jgi:hypothetical protein